MTRLAIFSNSKGVPEKLLAEMDKFQEMALWIKSLSVGSVTAGAFLVSYRIKEKLNTLR